MAATEADFVQKTPTPNAQNQSTGIRGAPHTSDGCLVRGRGEPPDPGTEQRVAGTDLPEEAGDAPSAGDWSAGHLLWKQLCSRTSQDGESAGLRNQAFRDEWKRTPRRPHHNRQRPIQASGSCLLPRGWKTLSRRLAPSYLNPGIPCSSRRRLRHRAQMPVQAHRTYKEHLILRKGLGPDASPGPPDPLMEGEFGHRHLHASRCGDRSALARGGFSPRAWSGDWTATGPSQRSCRAARGRTATCGD